VHGTSKMSRAIVLEALWRVTIWGITGRDHRLRRAAGSRAGDPNRGDDPIPGAPQRP
jgi:hypothetical protein